jgi:hypothetical protein
VKEAARPILKMLRAWDYDPPTFVWRDDELTFDRLSDDGSHAIIGAVTEADFRALAQALEDEG